jgi:hypothetical protein
MRSTATRSPLLRGPEAERALDIAERIFANARPLLGAIGAHESIGSYGGAAIVAEGLARAGRGGDGLVREVLRDALVFAPDRLGLYGGAAGLLVALDVVDPARASLAAVRERLRGALADSVANAPPVDFANMTAYDLISGVAGRAVALGTSVPAAGPAVRAYAERFADAVEERLAAPYDARAPINLGVSHGVPGILAALNFALPEERGPARRYVDLLLRMAHQVEGTYRWDAVWRPDEQPSARRAWCYQTVGVAAVLYDRARLDGDDGLRELAADALAAVLDERHDAEQSWDAALCHGRSGVAAVAWHFTGDERLVRHAAALARSVLDAYDPNRALGYRTLNLRDRVEEDRAEFLDAALGIAQFLIDAATAQERRWLPLLGLLPDEPPQQLEDHP